MSRRKQRKQTRVAYALVMLSALSLGTEAHMGDPRPGGSADARPQGRQRAA